LLEIATSFRKLADYASANTTAEAETPIRKTA
jgi:hypothetical protein